MRSSGFSHFRSSLSTSEIHSSYSCLQKRFLLVAAINWRRVWISPERYVSRDFRYQLKKTFFVITGNFIHSFICHMLLWKQIRKNVVHKTIDDGKGKKKLFENAIKINLCFVVVLQMMAHVYNVQKVGVSHTHNCQLVFIKW